MRHLLPLLIAIVTSPVFAQGPGMPARDSDELLARAATNSRRVAQAERLGAQVERTRDDRSFVIVWCPPAG